MDNKDEIIGGSISIDITEDVEREVVKRLQSLKKQYLVIGICIGVILTSIVFAIVI